jgi:hypothetical protein
MSGSNCLIACPDEIECDRRAILWKNRQGPIIAAETSAYREFNTHVFHGAAPKKTPTQRGGQAGAVR